jgi:hypothetical protein
MARRSGAGLLDAMARLACCPCSPALASFCTAFLFGRTYLSESAVDYLPSPVAGGAVTKVLLSPWSLFVFIPTSEQKSAPQLARMLLDIGQIDGVMFHQKLDCRPKDQERRNVDREHLNGFHGNLRADCRLGHYHIF